MKQETPSLILAQIRMASIDDLDSIVALVNAAYRGDSGRKGWTTESDLLDGQRIDRQQLEAILTRSENVVLVAVNEAAQLVGCVHVQKVSQQLAYLGMLTTNPETQGSGLGTQLLRAAESFARKNFGSSRVEMTVIDLRTGLIDWYLRRGYSATGEKRPFPYGDERFGIPRRRDLQFSVLETRL